MKNPVVLQHSEEDCGAACLATVAKYYGRNFSINRVREAVSTGQQGTSLLGLRQGAEALGFNARQVRATSQLIEKPNSIPLPAIIHWKGYHWVVLYGQRRRRYIVADPAVGTRYISRDELDEGWRSGIMLLLTPDESRFNQLHDDVVVGLGRALKKLWAYRNLLWQAGIINIAIGFVSLSIPFLVQILTDDVLVRQDTQLLTTLMLLALAVTVLSNILQLAQLHLIAHITARLELEVILEFGRKILHLPLHFYETRRSGEFLNRLQDIQEVNQLVAQIILNLPSQFFVALVSLGFMLIYSVRLTLVAVAVFALVMIPSLIFSHSLQQKTRNILAAEDEKQGILIETFQAALTLKTTHATSPLWEEFQHRFGSIANLKFRTVQIVIINYVSSNLISIIGSITILWLGSILTINRELTIGQLLAFYGMNANLVALSSSLISFTDEFIISKTAIQRLYEVLDAVPENEYNVQKPWVSLPADSNIVFTNFNFHHPGQTDLLKDFSLTIPGGKTTALIGRSGCGKSTLAKLIAGLYSFQSGSIHFGSYSQQDIALECLRQQVMLVPQEARFWTRSIIDNFRLSYPQLSFEHIVNTCQVVGADEFINKMPDGYQTVLGEFGVNMSGGQKQQLAIARAIVADPAILILDESTSALDPISEAEILDRLLSYRSDKTTIIISHRPKVIERAYWVILLEDGQVKLQNTRSQLKSFSGSHLNFFS